MCRNLAAHFFYYMLYWTKTLKLIKFLLSDYTWDVETSAKTVYLTFDDGPIPIITPWVLQQLKLFGAKATFFSIGKNVVENPELLKQIVADGHAVGNHTYNHVNGWKTSNDDYLTEVRRCDEVIFANIAQDRKLFRPPYGKIKPSAARQLKKQGYEIVMWDILSADFDQLITPKKCLQNVLTHIAPGSIIVFHDSIKAYKNLEYALPRTLKFLAEQGYNCEVLT